MVVTTGHPDIGGSRASIANMTAELLGIDYRRVSVLIGDTATIGFSNLTGGSRVLFASAMVVTQSAEKVITTLRERAAKIWKIDPEAVDWENGAARPAGDNAGKFEPLTLAQIAAKASATGGPIGAGVQLNTAGAEGGFATHICDVEVDRGPRDRDGAALHGRPGRRPRDPSALRRGPDAGRRRAGHRLGAERGVHLRQAGPLENAGFLDYRMPVAPTCR